MAAIDPLQEGFVRGWPTLPPGLQRPDFVKLIGEGVRFHRLVAASHGVRHFPYVRPIPVS